MSSDYNMHILIHSIYDELVKRSLDVYAYRKFQMTKSKDSNNEEDEEFLQHHHLYCIL